MSDVSTGITMEQLQTLLAAQAEMTKSIVAEAIKAAKNEFLQELVIDPTDIAYQAAVAHVIQAIRKIEL